MPKLTLSHIQSLKESGEKITALTAYDATFAQVLSTVGVELLLVGDSLGMPIAGHRTTVPVTMQQMIYHTQCVARNGLNSLIMVDLPFMTYSNPTSALKNAARLMQAGAEVIKLEGGSWLVETIRQMTQNGIPVCAHLGLTPQSVHLLGGYKVQGRTVEKAQQMVDTALQLEAAGARLLVLECVPYQLADKISKLLTIPTIGIGAGPYCDGQILVLYDMLGLTAGKPFTFVHNFLVGQTTGIQGAISNYVRSVKNAEFPTLHHSFTE